MTADDIGRLLSSRMSGRWSVLEQGASSFCETWIARSGTQGAFIKSVPLIQAEVLIAEADGLCALAQSRTVAVPAVIDCWVDRAHDIAMLAMQRLEFATPDAGFGERFGHSLAALHRAMPPGDGRFGWTRANMLGGTLQTNCWSSESGRSGWIEFFREQRLGRMRSAISVRRASSELLDALDMVIDRLPSVFDVDDYQPRPSLIHGDLWSGNWGMLADATPVIYDPAVSCSDAEAELAMMELFGSPPRPFWAAYRESAGLAPGYPRRRALYQLYHLLNHVVLFGSAYEPQAMDRARAVVRA